MLHTQEWLDLVNDALNDSRYSNYAIYNVLLEVKQELRYCLFCDRLMGAA